MHQPYPPHATAHTIAQAFAIANACVLSDIRTGGIKTTIDGHTWYDTRPMIDPNECSGPSIDMATHAISYATTTGLATRHPRMPWLLRVAPNGLPTAPDTALQE